MWPRNLKWLLATVIIMTLCVVLYYIFICVKLKFNNPVNSLSQQFSDMIFSGSLRFYYIIKFKDFSIKSGKIIKQLNSNDNLGLYF